jgi:ribosomal protein S18 acetylase RimI-like enzyme
MRIYVEKTWHRWIDDEQREWFTRNFLPERAQVIVAEGRDAGRLEVIRGPGELILATIEISPEFQSRGIGAAVVRDLQAEAKSASLPLRLQVLKANPRARQLYLRLAFRTVGETATHHLMSWP